MCRCEEERRSNLLVFADFLSLNLINLFNVMTISTYFRKGIPSQMTDCFVVPPRNDTLIERFEFVGNGR